MSKIINIHRNIDVSEERIGNIHDALEKKFKPVMLQMLRKAHAEGIDVKKMLSTCPYDRASRINAARQKVA